MPYTEWNFFHINLLSTWNDICLKKTVNNQKEDGDGPFYEKLCFYSLLLLVVVVKPAAVEWPRTFFPSPANLERMLAKDRN